jgi:hypothetical protein
MNKGKRTLFVFVILTIAGVVTFAFLRSGPRVVGQLPRADMRTIRSLVTKDSGAGLRAALRRASSDALAGWILDYRDGQLVRLEVQATNRVLAFLTTATPPQGRILMIERRPYGWQISETNNSVTFR